MSSFQKYLKRTAEFKDFRKEAKDILTSILETDLSLSQLNTLYAPKAPKPKTSDSLIRTPIQLPFDSEIDTNSLVPLKDPTIDVLKDKDNIVIATEKPIDVVFANKPTGVKEDTTYNFISSLLEEDDVIVPVELAPKELQKELKDSDDNSEEDKKKDTNTDEYDVLIAIPKLSPEELQQIITVVDKQHMMKEPPLGSVMPVHPSAPIEADPIGLSMAGLENDLALKFL